MQSLRQKSLANEMQKWLLLMLHGSTASAIEVSSVAPPVAPEAVTSPAAEPTSEDTGVQAAAIASDSPGLRAAAGPAGSPYYAAQPAKK